jgi:hypothetical protein
VIHTKQSDEIHYDDGDQDVLFADERNGKLKKISMTLNHSPSYSYMEKKIINLRETPKK